jgi:hypothetical protein
VLAAAEEAAKASREAAESQKAALPLA